MYASFLGAHATALVGRYALTTSYSHYSSTVQQVSRNVTFEAVRNSLKRENGIGSEVTLVTTSFRLLPLT